MKIFNLSNILKYRLYIIIGLAALIGVFLIILAFFMVFSPNSMQGIKSNNIIFNLNSYIAEYNLTIISNKTENCYSIKEWYKKQEGKEYFKFTSKDFMQNDYSITISDSKLKIENSMQISRYITTIDKNNTNLYSLATYIEIINSGAFKIDTETSEVTVKYIINLKDVLNKELAEKYEDITNSNLNLDHLELYIIANKPVYIKCISNEKECIKIDYTEFTANEEIDMSIFEV